jgi:copper chaperone NosL
LFLARLTLACAAAVALAGCGTGDDLGPPDIHFGQDTCHACGMIIEDDRYAAAVVTVTAAGDIERRLFDDVGEMLEAAPPAGARSVRRYARDAATRRWLDADKATFAKTRDLPTPMGSGIAAYADPAAARAAIDAHGGSLLTPAPTSAPAAP